MAPLPSISTRNSSTLTTRCSASFCYPGPQQTSLIIGVVFGAIGLFLIILALWYHGCLCCWSRKATRGPSDGYKKVEGGGNGPMILAGGIQTDSDAMTSYVGGVGSGVTTGGSGGFTDIGGGGLGGSASGGDCAVM